MQYNAMEELKKHRAKYGTHYRLPNGKSVLIKDSNIKEFLTKDHLPNLMSTSLSRSMKYF